jgi:hypothetical protein
MTHLGYCTNIHSGETWEDHFAILQESIPQVKAKISPDKPFGIGLRLAHKASLTLAENTGPFKQWLKEQNCYVFTMNGFPYGEFHDTAVKDKVHAPDWTTDERREFTIRIFKILADILPTDLNTAGISTSPLSYRYWWETQEALQDAVKLSTSNILEVVKTLIDIKSKTGKSLHLDIEPEPDGILESGAEFIEWYTNVLVPAAKQIWKNGEEIVKEHVQLCYDVCHFAVGYEEPAEAVAKLAEAGIKTGKIQISSALRVDLKSDEEAKIKVLQSFDEPVYLHQVVALKKDGTLERFRDLAEATAVFSPEKYDEWRVHFHVPLFTENYQILGSTQSEIVKTLQVLKETGFTDQLEVETYTWGVLPKELQLPLNESIIRELEWVKGALSV